MGVDCVGGLAISPYKWHQMFSISPLVPNLSNISLLFQLLSSEQSKMGMDYCYLGLHHYV